MHKISSFVLRLQRSTPCCRPLVIIL